MIVHYEKLKAHAAIIEGMVEVMQQFCNAKYTDDSAVQDLAGRILIQAHWLLKEGFSPDIE